ncbi:hypothetical protein [Streptomyces gobiensis]|uniref:hypothetical protein n=1 Tax=Streptomyces gobiensis TaxID=2875706 RepID=UPI001E5B20A6|nr:hypothetical protein [Streptomyces gobiensis]UGY93264.1 hypothetical protein test1122_17100 [Streptomyces gobiensis]
MPELQGSYRVHFVLALALCGAELLLVCATWLPGEPVVPSGLVIGLFILVFPVFASALIRTLISGVGAVLMGPENAGRLVRYVGLLPRVMKFTYGLILCLAVLGIATAASDAQDAHADEDGYYYTRWNNDTRQSERVPLTRDEFHQAHKDQNRIFAAGPALFYGMSSFLVLASASATAGTRSAA